jgi:hypothetical protein
MAREVLTSSPTVDDDRDSQETTRRFDPMNKLVASTLATSSLLLATAGLGIAGSPADIGFDPNRMFFQYAAPGVNSGAFQVLPDNRHDPIVLPCDVQMFGGGIDIVYAGAGPTVFPKLTLSLFDDQNKPIVSAGCLNNQVLTSESGNMGAMTAGTVQNDGYTAVSSTSQFCAWLFQPSDLPADEVVRMHMQLTAYPDGTYQGSVVGDPNPANNAHDIYVRRSCSCQ